MYLEAERARPIKAAFITTYNIQHPRQAVVMVVVVSSGKRRGGPWAGRVVLCSYKEGLPSLPPRRRRRHPFSQHKSRLPRKQVCDGNAERMPRVTWAARARASLALAHLVMQIGSLCRLRSKDDNVFRRPRSRPLSALSDCCRSISLSLRRHCHSVTLSPLPSPPPPFPGKAS